MTDLHSQLRRERLRRGYTIEQAAKRVGVGSAHLNRVERGIATPSLALVRWIAEAYETVFTVGPENEQAPD